MDVPALMVEMTTGAQSITLNRSASVEIFQKITQCKSYEVKETLQIGNKVKQDVLVPDQSGPAKVCLWEDVNTMQEHVSYSLNLIN